MAAGQTAETTATTGQGTTATSQTAPAARAILDRSVEVTKSAVSQLKPWSEFVDRAAFARPESFGDATNRISKNSSYFWGNYLLITTGVVALSLVLHPASLLVLIVLVGLWVAFYTFFQAPLTICGRVCNEKEVVAGGLVASLLILLTTGAIGTILWALLTSALVLSVHGALRVPDDLFLDEQPSSAGFLTFLGGNSSQPVPVAMNRV